MVDTKEIPFNDIVSKNQSYEQAFIKQLSELIASGRYVLGEAVAELESKLSQWLGVQHAISVNSGTDALFLSLKALGIGKKDEVITVSNSFVGTAGAIAATGAKPVFIDVGTDLNIDVSEIEAAITPATKAIMPVHLTGRPADMINLCAIARNYELKVVEDGAQALGAKLGSRFVGGYGDCGCFSFHPFKVLGGIGDGGMIVTDDDDIAASLKALRNHGIAAGGIQQWGYNSRLDTVQAELLLQKLPDLEADINRRNEIASLYQELLPETLQKPIASESYRCVYQTYIVNSPYRNDLKAFLQEKGIGTDIHYPVPIHLQPVGKDLGYDVGDLPNTERLASEIISLPIYLSLKNEDVEYVCEQINQFFNEGEMKQYG